MGLPVRFSYELAWQVALPGCPAAAVGLATTRLSLLEMALGMVDLTDVHILLFCYTKTVIFPSILLV